MSEILFSFGDNAESAAVQALTAPDFRNFAEGFISQFPEVDESTDLANDDHYATLKSQLPYICAGMSNGKRSKANAQPVQWLAMDVDKNCTSADVVKMRRKLRGIEHLFYTTAGDKRRGDDQRRFRLLVAVSRPLTHADHVFTGGQFGAWLSSTVEFDQSVWKAEQPIFPGLVSSVAQYSPGKPLDVDQWGPAPVKTHSVAASKAIDTDGAFIDALEEQGTATSKGYKLQSMRGGYSSPSTPDDILIQAPVKGQFDQWRIEWLHDTDKRALKTHDMYSVLADCGYSELALMMKRENHRIHMTNKYATLDTPAFSIRKDQPKADPVAEARAELAHCLADNPDLDGWSVDAETGKMSHPSRNNMKGPVAKAAIKLRAAVDRAYAEHLASQGFPSYPSWMVLGGKKTKLAAAGTIAQDVDRAWSGRLRYDPALRKSEQRSYGLVRYNGQFWQEFDMFGAHISEAIEREDGAPEARFVDQVAAALVIRLETIPEQSPNTIAFRNGSFNVRTGKFMDHSPAHGMRAALNVDYDPDGRTQPATFLGWIDQISQGDEDLRYAMLAGLYYVMGGFSSYKCFLELVGPPNGGKSVYATLCAALVGGYDNVLATSLRTLSRDAHALASYPRKRLVYIPETDGGYSRSDKIKQLTGNDGIEVRPMGIAPYTVQAHAPVILVGNAPVEWSDITEGLVARRTIIPFDYVVPQQDQVLDFHKLLIDELPEIISYLVDTFPDGAKKELDYWRAHSKRAQEIAREADPVAEFAALLQPCDDWLVIGGCVRAGDPNGPKPARNLRHAFDMWCELENYKTGKLKTRDFRNKLLVELRRLHKDVPVRVNANYTETRMRIPVELLR